MSDVTVEQLAEQIGDISLNKLLKQLKRAGVKVSNSNDIVSEVQKEKLLVLLQQEHGDDATVEKVKKISLKRTSVSEIKVKRASGKNSTVNIIYKRRRMYVKREIPKKEEKPKVEITTPKEDNIAAVTTVVNEVKDRVTLPLQSEILAVKVDDEQKIEPLVCKKVSKSLEKQIKPIIVKKVDKLSSTSESNHDRNRRKHKVHSSKDNMKKEAVKSHLKEKRGKSKAKLIIEDRERSLHGRYRRRKFKGRAKHVQIDAEKLVNPHAFEKPTELVVHEVKIPETITIVDLAQKMSVKASEVITIMMKLGAMVTINQVVDRDTACLLVGEMGHKPLPVNDVNVDESIVIAYEDSCPRSPIVTVMGHVDHGKTSLLDYIRLSRVTANESGGITQHIGAYQVKTPFGEITFLDTPGHAAFTLMRARGVSCTDVVIIVVAADDGVMPQTIEAIQHAKAANVPVVVAINKIDKSGADIARVTNELSKYELIPESWGGKTIFVPISAKEGTGVTDLIEAVMLQVEMLELKAPQSGPAQGVVVEAYLDKGRGPVTTLLVQQGALSIGDVILAGLEYGRVKGMRNDKNEQIEQVGPSIPVELIGLSGVPKAGDIFQVAPNEKKAREIAFYRQGKQREIRLSRQHTSTLEGFMERMQQGGVNVLNIVLKADVQGSVEAIVDALVKLSMDEVNVKIITKGVGGFNESDINLAIASNAILVGFNIRADALARRLAQKEGIQINYYSVIYEMIDSVKAVLHGRLEPKFCEKIVGIAEVKEVFRSSKSGVVAGCMVVDGTIKRSNQIRVLRDNIVIYRGQLESLRRFKDSVTEVRNGMECGIGVKNYSNIKASDLIEFFEMTEVVRELL